MNLTGPPESVNRTAPGALPTWVWAALAGGLALKVWLVAGVDLGKDEAAYWYWARHLDAAYALVPFAAAALADAAAPRSDALLRLPFHAAGVLALWLLYTVCRRRGLPPRASAVATAALATTHWWWHTSSFLHPDAFLVPAWLAALVCTERAVAGDGDGWWSAAGTATALAALSKYSGLVLAAGWFLYPAWLAWRGRRGPLARAALPFLLLTAPLAGHLVATGFALPRALASLSAVASGPVPVRLAWFTVAPLAYVSPFLLGLLYATAWRCRRARGAGHLLVPGLVVLLFFAFFAAARGQVKGNWVLPAFLGLWPAAFSGAWSRRPALVGALILVGALHLVVPAVSLHAPALAARLLAAAPATWNATYAGTVSARDLPREPTFTWTERVCEYHGWPRFGAHVDAALADAGLPERLTLASDEYGLAFGLARYTRRVQAVAIPRDARFAGIAADPDSALVLADRAGLPRPSGAGDTLAVVPRAAPGCAPVEYVLYRVGPAPGAGPGRGPRAAARRRRNSTRRSSK